MIHSSTQAQKLSKIAEKYTFDIWIHGKSGHADAKSLLGLMLLTIENDVRLVVPDGVDTAEFEKEIEEFRVR
jgi:phosphotransferase system HPr-like phosphotransfer protein